MSYLWLAERVAKQTRAITMINIALAVIVFIMIAGAMVGSLYFFMQTRRLEQTVTQNYELNGEWYTCEHTHGNMECWLTSDPDVGFGRSE